MEDRNAGDQVGLKIPANERHLSPKEIAEMWGLSENTVRNLFRHEPDVLLLRRPATRGKRGYTSVRIPESVAKRVHGRMSNGRLQTPSES